MTHAPIKKIRAVTLLELLLVIVLSSALLMIGAALLRQYALTVKVKTAATQIQQILQAGNDYYIDTNAWPDNSTDNFTNYYLPFHPTVTPWGGNYDYSSPDGIKFQVIARGIPAAMAARVKDLLPSAALTCNGNQCDLLAEVTIPTNGRANLLRAGMVSNVKISKMQLINLQFAKGQYVNVVTDSFVCPAGWKGFAIPSLAGMILSDTSSNWRSACGRVFKNSIREIDPTYAKPASGYSRYCYSSDGVHNTCYFSVSALTWRGRKVALNCWSQHDKTNFGPLLEFTVILGCCNPRSGIQCPPYQEVTP